MSEKMRRFRKNAREGEEGGHGREKPEEGKWNENDELRRLGEFGPGTGPGGSGSPSEGILPAKDKIEAVTEGVVKQDRKEIIKEHTAGEMSTEPGGVETIGEKGQVAEVPAVEEKLPTPEKAEPKTEELSSPPEKPTGPEKQEEKPKSFEESRQKLIELIGADRMQQIEAIGAKFKEHEISFEEYQKQRDQIIEEGIKEQKVKEKPSETPTEAGKKPEAKVETPEEERVRLDKELGELKQKVENERMTTEELEKAKIEAEEKIKRMRELKETMGQGKLSAGGEKEQLQEARGAAEKAYAGKEGEESLMEEYIDQNLFKKTTEKELELEEKIKGARIAGGQELSGGEKRALERDFYLKELDGYFLKYEGGIKSFWNFLTNKDRFTVLKDGKPIERDGRPLKFEANWWWKTPKEDFIKFLKVEFEEETINKLKREWEDYQKEHGRILDETVKESQGKRVGPVQTTERGDLLERMEKESQQGDLLKRMEDEGQIKITEQGATQQPNEEEEKPAKQGPAETAGRKREKLFHNPNVPRIYENFLRKNGVTEEELKNMGPLEIIEKAKKEMGKGAQVGVIKGIEERGSKKIEGSSREKEEEISKLVREIQEKRLKGKEPGYTWKEIDEVLKKDGITPGTPEADRFMKKWDLRKAEEEWEKRQKRESRRVEKVAGDQEKIEKHINVYKFLESSSRKAEGKDKKDWSFAVEEMKKGNIEPAKAAISLMLRSSKRNLEKAKKQKDKPLVERVTKNIEKLSNFLSELS